MYGNGGSYRAPWSVSPGNVDKTSAPSPITVSTRSAATIRTSSEPGGRTRTYSMSLPAATAAFEIRVQGVVVQTSSESPSRTGLSGRSSDGATAVTGRRTKTAGSTTSR
jgi:hypothetical protein